MQLTQAVISQPRQMLVEVPITGTSGQRDVAPVGNSPLAFDENFNSYANLASASWQSITFEFDSVRVAKVRVKTFTYEGNRPKLNCGGVFFYPVAENVTEWYDIDRDASNLSIGDATGGRTRLYELSIYTLE